MPTSRSFSAFVFFLVGCASQSLVHEAAELEALFKLRSEEISAKVGAQQFSDQERETFRARLGGFNDRLGRVTLTAQEAEAFFRYWEREVKHREP